jgi:acyl-CoA-binding protein
MEDLEIKFNKYIIAVKKLAYVSDNDKLYLYANYKQALIGNNNNEKPSILNRVEMAKWKQWYSLKDTNKETAMKNYIRKVKELYKNYKNYKNYDDNN